MIKIGKAILIFIFTLFPLMSMADEVNVQATVDRNQMYTGDTFTLTVSVSSSGNVNIQQPKLPSVADFDLLNTWTGNSTVSTFVNGKFEVKRTRNFNYLFAPKKAGQLVVGAFSIASNNNVYKTKPITITVKSGTAQPNNRAQNNRKKQRRRGNQVDPFAQMEEEMDEVFNQMLRRRGKVQQAPQNINPDDVFFLDVVVDKDEVFVGEQVTVSWYFYTRNSLTNIQNLKFPDLKGFWKEDIEVVTSLNYTNEVINGVVYRKALLVSYALFPIKSGTATIDPYKVKCKFRMPGILGFKETDYITKASRSLNIEVLPLPAESKPLNFTGGVGQFQLSSKLGQAEYKENEPFSLNIKFYGKGNAKRIDLAEINLPEGLELYDTKSQAQFNKNGTSHKNYELFLIPRKQGTLEIPPIEFAFFDPKTRQYYTRSTQNFSIQVAKGADSQVIAESRVKSKAPEALEDENTFPAPILEWQSGFHISHFQRSIIWSAVMAMIALILLWQAMVEFAVFDKHHGIEADIKTRISKIMADAAKDKWREVGIDASNLIYFLLGELSGQGGANRQAQQLIDLCPPSVRRELGEDLISQLNEFEELAFAPEEVVKGKADPKSLKSQVKKLEKLCKATIKLAASEKS